MVELRGYIQKVARSDANVLITGATGTGKERVAETIHFQSARRNQPFVCVNCAAIPDSLIESELFGFERGAFTGAQQGYPGKLRLANKGTVFLDEIGDMSLAAQAKVLRVIENGELFPLGARRVSKVDVRYVAAVNQDVEQILDEKKFRRDLYYRLNVARIRLLPLRERKEDIPELMMHYIDHFNRRFSSKVGEPTQELLECLINYDWPGNIRELRNLVEAIFIDPPAGAVSPSELPESFRQIYAGYVESSVTERERLVSVLSQTRWNKTKAASQLNWSRMTLYRKLSKYQIIGPAGSHR